MSDTDPRRALELAYRDAFEVSKAGQVVLAHLVHKFKKVPPLDGSTASMNRAVIVAAQTEVVEYIVRMINRANDVPEPPEGEET
jgi:hypothetical protein